MKTFTVILVALSGCACAFAFEIMTPEREKADAAWERTIRRQFDFERLHEFLLRTLAEQKRFKEVDLASSRTGKAWVVNRHHRILHSGGWWFRRDEKGAGFQFRYYPGEGEHEVVLVCEREGRGKFRLMKIRWDVMTLELVRDEGPRNAREQAVIHMSLLRSTSRFIPALPPSAAPGGRG